jgi:hypothetical protein
VIAALECRRVIGEARRSCYRRFAPRGRPGGIMKAHRVVTAMGLSIGCSMLTVSARSDLMDCRGRIVSTGDSLSEVRELCSDPDTASHRIEIRTIRGPDRCCTHHGRTECRPGDEITIVVEVDDWTYDFGRNRFVRYLRFERGHLTSIATGSYGRKPPQ